MSAHDTPDAARAARPPTAARPAPCVRDLLAAGVAATAVSTPPRPPEPLDEGPGVTGPASRDAA
ncbi:hypothetical protein AQ490_08575 [Wenjunlia vitaminophila]|uniref:Uncharacterized protein n=1 Tax=Wenjunlia vitaminophila TaxID=76728 RepID=A0A0T6LL82_WENVI|nr:hypothetical protein [Wenjunlia vitaminophila]KRV46832.1 hypothetical protein AQ490_08575 [Wenjunlia vitaminophila]